MIFPYYRYRLYRIAIDLRLSTIVVCRHFTLLMIDHDIDIVYVSNIVLQMSTTVAAEALHICFKHIKYFLSISSQLCQQIK